MGIIKYIPGDVIAVRVDSGWAAALIRIKNKGDRTGDNMYCYGFDVTAYDPAKLPIELCTPERIVCTEACEDVFVRNGSWPVVGRIELNIPDWPTAPERMTGPDALSKSPVSPATMDAERLLLTSEVEWSINIRNNGIVTYEEYLSLPPARGYGLDDSLQITVNRALAGNPRYRCVPNMLLWKRINEQAIARGLMSRG